MHGVARALHEPCTAPVEPCTDAHRRPHGRPRGPGTGGTDSRTPAWPARASRAGVPPVAGRAAPSRGTPGSGSPGRVTLVGCARPPCGSLYIGAAARQCVSGSVNSRPSTQMSVGAARRAAPTDTQNGLPTVSPSPARGRGGDRRRSRGASPQRRAGRGVRAWRRRIHRPCSAYRRDARRTAIVDRRGSGDRDGTGRDGTV